MYRWRVPMCSATRDRPPRSNSTLDCVCHTKRWSPAGDNGDTDRFDIPAPPHADIQSENWSPVPALRVPLHSHFSCDVRYHSRKNNYRCKSLINSKTIDPHEITDDADIPDFYRV